MNKCLFLGGGGDPDVSAKFDKEYFELLTQDSRILYIPLAWNHPKIKLTDCYEWFCGLVHNYINIPRTNIFMYDGTVSYKLDDFDAIYIGGGNTYKLRDGIEKFHLTNDLKKFIESERPVYGGSAGAILFGKEIATVIEEKLDYPNYKGLGFCDFSIRCHYQDKDEEKLKNISKDICMEVYALPEDSGMILDSKFHLLKTIGKVKLFKPKL